MEENEARKKNVVHPSTTRRNKFDRPIRPVEPEFYLGNSDQTASCQLDRVPPLKKDQSLSVYLVARTIMRKIRRRRERRVGKAFKDFDVGPCQSAKLSRALVRGTIFHLLRIPKSSLHSILSRQWFGNLGEVFRLRNTSVLESLFVKGVQGPPCSRVLIAPLVLLCSLS